ASTHRIDPLDSPEATMEISRTHRVIASLLAALFIVLGMAFWLVPEATALRMGLQAMGAGGLSTLRADLGGLFVGISLLGAAAAWSKRRGWLFAATLVLGAIVLGRSIGWFIDDQPSGLVELGVELGALGALAFCLHGSRPQSGEPAGAAR